MTGAPPILKLMGDVAIQPLLAQLEANPQLWNQNRFRTEGAYGNPHSKLSDIIVRFNDWANWKGDRMQFCERHEPVWWGAYEVLTYIEELVFDLMRLVRGEHLGMVLITKIPPHTRCEPHTDAGWNAVYHDKYLVSLKANDQQRFCYEGYHLVTAPGDLCMFRNDISHWVENDSDEDRWSLIICIRNRWTPSAAEGK